MITPKITAMARSVNATATITSGVYSAEWNAWIFCIRIALPRDSSGKEK